MSDRSKIPPPDNSANMKNRNKGTSGTNRQYDQAQGNRGKQKNPSQKRSKMAIVTFRVPKGFFSFQELQAKHLRITSKGELLSRGIVSNNHWTLQAYDYLSFTKGVKGGEKNISGALQRIGNAMKGHKPTHSSDFWINSRSFVDDHHPDELADYLEYCPAIDGYY